MIICFLGACFRVQTAELDFRLPCRQRPLRFSMLPRPYRHNRHWVQLLGKRTLQRFTAYDTHIFEDTRYLHPQFNWELYVGDGHFSICPRFHTSVPAIADRLLTPQESNWNEWIHASGSYQEHQQLNQGAPYVQWSAVSRSVIFFRVFVNITLHATAAELRARGNRYEVFRPWPHHTQPM